MSERRFVESARMFHRGKRRAAQSRSERAAGLLVGLALADGWSRATETALCVADAVATGLPLDDERALDLLRRNIRSMHDATHATGANPASGDAVLAACAVFAVAHHREKRAEWEAALEAMLDVLEVPIAARDGLSSWADSIAELITTGAWGWLDPEQTSHWSTTLRAIAETCAALEADDTSRQSEPISRVLFTESEALRLAPAATGAIAGALMDVEALPEEMMSRLNGWPDADGASLVSIADDVVAPRERGAPGVPLPIGVRSPAHDSAALARAQHHAWCVARVTLAARDMQENR